MTFKVVKWNRAIGDYFTAYAPFGLELTVYPRGSRYRWDLSNGYYALKVGYCATMEKAKENCEKAYHAYVESNMAKVFEDFA